MKAIKSGKTETVKTSGSKFKITKFFGTKIVKRIDSKDIDSDTSTSTLSGDEDGASRETQYALKSQVSKPDQAKSMPSTKIAENRGPGHKAWPLGKTTEEQAPSGKSDVVQRQEGRAPRREETTKDHGPGHKACPKGKNITVRKDSGGSSKPQAQEYAGNRGPGHQACSRKRSATERPGTSKIRGRPRYREETRRGRRPVSRSPGRKGTSSSTVKEPRQRLASSSRKRSKKGPADKESSKRFKQQIIMELCEKQMQFVREMLTSDSDSE